MAAMAAKSNQFHTPIIPEVWARLASSRAPTSPVGPTATIVVTRFMVGGGLKLHQSSLNPTTVDLKGDTNETERCTYATPNHRPVLTVTSLCQHHCRCARCSSKRNDAGVAGARRRRRRRRGVSLKPSSACTVSPANKENINGPPNPKRIRSRRKQAASPEGNLGRVHERKGRDELRSPSGPDDLRTQQPRSSKPEQLRERRK